MSASEDSVQTQILKPEIRQKRKNVDENKIITIKGRPSQID